MFKVSDKVRRVGSVFTPYPLAIGEIYTVAKVINDRYITLEGISGPYYSAYFELVKESPMKNTLEVGKTYKTRGNCLFVVACLYPGRPDFVIGVWRSNHVGVWSINGTFHGNAPYARPDYMADVMFPNNLYVSQLKEGQSGIDTNGVKYYAMGNLMILRKSGKTCTMTRLENVPDKLVIALEGEDAVKLTWGKD